MIHVSECTLSISQRCIHSTLAYYILFTTYLQQYWDSKSLSGLYHRHNRTIHRWLKKMHL